LTGTSVNIAVLPLPSPDRRRRLPGAEASAEEAAAAMIMTCCFVVECGHNNIMHVVFLVGGGE